MDQKNSTVCLKAAIFDLDGTLLDSMGLWHEVDEIFFFNHGMTMPQDYGTVIAPMGFPAAAAYTKKVFSLPISEEEIIEEWNALALEAYANRISEKPYVADYLLSLKSRNIPFAAATASHREYWEPALKRCHLMDLFQSFTEIKEVSRGKGFPDIYLAAAAKLGIHPSECVVFEDIATGLEGANAGGFYTVGVYDSHHTDQAKIMRLCDRYIHSFKELIDCDIFDGGTKNNA